MSARVSLRIPALLAVPDDRALVARFVAERDEAAFAELVRRHGSMVLGVCRRAVRDAHHAEDAFQATFLALARNPVAASGASSVGAWLHGVARRVGLSAHRRLRRAGGVSPPVEEHNRPAYAARSQGSDFDDLLRVLDEEVARLPDECRAAVVACFLREQTQDDAARQLGWSLSTLRRRLDRAKDLLRARLTRRGATLSAALLTGSVAKASVPAPLVEATVRAAESGSATPPVAALAASGLRTSHFGKIALAAAALAAGGFAFALQPPPPEPAPAPRVVEARPWVTLTGRVVLPNRVPVPLAKEVTGHIRDADHNRKNGPVIDEALLVNQTNLGVRNAVVWLRPDSDDPKAAFPKDKIHPDPAAAKPRTHEVVINCCQFEPRVTAARAGDTVVFKNRSAIPHNVNYYSYPNGDGVQEFNVLVRADGEYRAATPLTATNRIGSSFRCSIHPWMQGYVWAFDHPYFAVTDADGTFEIKNVPVGNWRVVVWHEKVGYRDGKAGRLGHKRAVADGGGLAELPPTPLDSPAWDDPRE